jgi:hypothetical protein
MNFTQASEDLKRSIGSVAKLISDLSIFGNSHTHAEDPQHAARVKAKETLSGQRLSNAVTVLETARDEISALAQHPAFAPLDGAVAVDTASVDAASENRRAAKADRAEAREEARTEELADRKREDADEARAIEARHKKGGQ